MKLTKKTTIQSLQKGLIKQTIEEKAFENFCKNLKVFIESLDSAIRNSQTEEHLKSHLAKFLSESFYNDSNAIAPKSYKGQIQADLIIHESKEASSASRVLIEAKKPSNKAEMICLEDLNKKAFHEAIFYFLFEKEICKNNEIKHLIVTDFNEFFVFDGEDIAKHFYYEASELVKEFQKWSNRQLDSQKTELFYSLISSFIEQKASQEISCAYFNLKDFSVCLNSLEEEQSTEKLALLYKLLCPQNLLKKATSNDSNTLNREFYNELLHIIGLEEKEEGSKKLIRRKAESRRNSGSLIENLIDKLNEEGKLSKINEVYRWGNNVEERLFNIALELSITWINRILFLKLLEAQLFKYHNKDELFKFLNLNKIQSWSDLRFLFFKVLAVKERQSNLRGFEHIPYLNSSLFEMTELEQEISSIDYLTQDSEIPVFEKTVLKDSQGNKLKNAELNTLKYLIEFLSAYDFGAEATEPIRKDNKTLINASVLGLIFEKINGYKDGSFFTPGYITMYMCRETITRAIIDKFNSKCNLASASIDELREEIYRKKISLQEANELVDSLKICDPAVGSGHFLVSALNEIIALKSELGILLDEEGKKLPVSVWGENDELVIVDRRTDLPFEYKVKSFNSLAGREVLQDTTKIQKAIFQEKQKVIENCLFGVDINPNSVQICCLRLWIELLKNAYYIPETGFKELQTLPNIDINIKQGNSLISRYSLDEHLTEKNISETIKDYLQAVQDYKNSTDKTLKENLKQKIKAIKESFHVDLFKNNELVRKKQSKNKRLNELSIRLQSYLSNLLGAVLSERDLKKRKKEETALKKEIEKLEVEMDGLDDQIKEVQEGQIYKTGFEWRFEFPEVLDEKGDFVGFDVVIGNPPYIRQEEIKDLKPYLKDKFEIFNSIADIYTYFIERGNSVLKNNGHFAFIVSNKFTRANYGQNLKNYLLSKTELNSFIDFSGIPVFDNATVDAAILSFRKNPPAPLTGGALKDAPLEALGETGNFKYSKEIAELADKMREQPTPAEKYLWDNILRSSQLGFKFTRQKPIHNFILDFYCSELLLGIEADGDIHDLQKEQDRLRTEYLESIGIKIIRFKNEEILKQKENVKNKIIEYTNERKKELSRTNPISETPPVKGAGQGFCTS